MPDADSIPPAAARRAQLGAAAIVALVVIVLGFGAGIGAVFERDDERGDSGGSAAATVTPRPSPAGGRVDASVTPSSVPTGTGPARRAAGAAPAGRAPAGAGGGSSGGAVPGSSTTTTTTTPPVTPSTSPPTTAPPPSAGSCSGLLAVMVNPFWAHFEAAHLETSPGQQVADALNADDYAVAHTNLIAAVLAPLVNLVFDIDGTSPLWTHLRAAHLESSPGQQVADLLNVDDYLLAHTVLVDDMLIGGSGGC
jgi:hypothetical protein